MRVGSLFTGYGGLDLAVGGDLAWYAEIEPAACKVLAHHYPGVPNLGDVTTINWSEIEPVDVITGGYPCQPFSYAGNRKGEKDVRHLWPHVLDAIRAIRPRYAIMENVSGHLTLGFADVLTNLAEIGWSAEWGTFRASDIGAPHRRERLFVIAYSERGIRGKGSGRGISEPERTTGFTTRDSRITTDTVLTGLQGHNGKTITTPATGHELNKSGRSAPTIEINWGKYLPAIIRWERSLDRQAPPPTVKRKDKLRLNSQFVEWLMGLPEGWVTGHGLTPAQELKMLGNGVVPQQASEAITQLMERVGA